MSYKQITELERYRISEYRIQGLNQNKIAEKLRRDPSTISREVRRNQHVEGSYHAPRAQEHAHARRWRTRKGPQFSSEQWSLVCHFIEAKWSPEQISLVFNYYEVFSISHETIYRYIWRDKKNGGRLYRHLRQSPKHRRKRYRSRDSRGILRGKRPISDRPYSAEKRRQRGHFEVDIVHGKRSRACILTLVDRTTRLTLIRKLKDKSMREVNRALILLIRRYGILTITADNGSEFHEYKRIERLTGVAFYFCQPYHSWERGTCENTNGLIRQYIPKNASMKYLSQWVCNAIAAALNTRPRKVLNLRTPEEAHFTP